MKHCSIGITESIDMKLSTYNINCHEYMSVRFEIKIMETRRNTKRQNDDCYSLWGTGCENQISYDEEDIAANTQKCA